MARPEPKEGESEDGSGNAGVVNPKPAYAAPGANTVEGPREPAETQPVRGAGVRAGPGRKSCDTGRDQVVCALGGGGRSVKNPVVLIGLPEARTLTGQSGKAVAKTRREEPQNPMEETVTVGTPITLVNPACSQAQGRPAEMAGPGVVAHAMGERQASTISPSIDAMGQSGETATKMAASTNPGVVVREARKLVVDGGPVVVELVSAPSSLEGGGTQDPHRPGGLASSNDVVASVGVTPGSRECPGRKQR